METLWRDIVYGVRMLANSPGFTIVAMLSLAIGVGANSTIFSITNALLLRPLPYKDADRIAILWNRSPGLNIDQDWFSPGQYLDIKAENQVFASVAVTIGASFNLTGLGVPEHVDGARVSSSLFPLLGANALYGRLFTAEEDQPGKPPVVILGNKFWQRYCNSDPSFLGRTLTLNGNNLTIVGVMPASFSLSKEIMPAVNAIENADLLLPLPMAETARSNRGNEDFNIFAKLKPGISVTQAQGDMDVIASRMKQNYPASYPPHGGLTISVVPLLSQVVGDIRFALIVVFGAVGLVLLIGCANVANLLLSRAAIRQKEIAIRSAVGASLTRLVRQLLTESALLALGGGIIGFVMAIVAVRALRFLAPENIPRVSEIGIDARVLVFTFLISLLTAVVFGLVPTLRASRVDPIEVLKDGGRGTNTSLSGRGQQRTRRLLVVGEMAISLILLIGAGLLIRSYWHVFHSSQGFNPTNVLSLRLSLPASKYSKPELIAAFFKEASTGLQRLPGVQSVGTTYSLPMSAVAFAWEPISIDGYAQKTAYETIISNVRIVSPGYFPAMGIPLVKGRYFDERDIRGQQETAIVDEALAERFWPNDDPIGKRVQRGKDGPWRTVIGVINDRKQYGAEKEPPIAVYYPAGQVIARNMYIVIRTNDDPLQHAGEVTKVIQTLDPELPVFDVKAMEGRLHGSLAGRRFAMTLLGILAVIALGLAAIGVYGVIAYSVTQRTHEIGIRMALGAKPFSIVKLVLSQAMTLVGIGIAIGLAGALALTRLISSLLYGISATDVVTFIVTPLFLAGVAALASYLPARRASRVDPMIALRYE